MPPESAISHSHKVKKSFQTIMEFRENIGEAYNVVSEQLKILSVFKCSNILQFFVRLFYVIHVCEN